MVVVIEVVWDRIVGNEEVGPAVIVVVGPDDAETVIADFIVNAGLRGNFLECAVTTVVVQKIAFTHKTPRAALYKYTFVPTILVATELRQIVHIHVSVTGDEKVHIAVTIIVAPGRAGHKAAAAHAGLVGNVFKLAIAQIVVKRVPSVAADKQVELAVVVVIGDSHA